VNIIEIASEPVLRANLQIRPKKCRAQFVTNKLASSRSALPVSGIEGILDGRFPQYCEPNGNLNYSDTSRLTSFLPLVSKSLMLPIFAANSGSANNAAAKWRYSDGTPN
jgi:hypothetical protein